MFSSFRLADWIVPPAIVPMFLLLLLLAVALLHGWRDGMTLFVFDDAYGWNASISRPVSEGDNFYRTCTLDLITRLKARYDLDTARLPDRDDIF